MTIKVQTRLVKPAAVSLSAMLLAGIVLLSACAKPAAIDYTGPVADWQQYGGSPAGLRYSPLTQITPENLDHLRVAWTYRVSPTDPNDKQALPAMEATPIVADGRMYLCSTINSVIALDPETGRELWTYDPHIQVKGTWLRNCRGVTYYRDTQAATGAACATRIITGTLDARLIELDAVTGKPCEDFGVGGTVDLKAGMGPIGPGEYNVSSPPTVAADRIILSAQVLDNERIDAPAGVIRAFDVRTGALTWAWNPLPPGRTDAELAPPGETYARGTTNAWSVFAVDAERGLVFVPTGNTSPDHFGGMRHGLDYYSSSVVALEAATGRVVWRFQTIHHDIWDYDIPAQPVLFDFPSAQGPVPALAQATKQGMIFILNRETGEPLVPVQERAVSQEGAVPEEVLSPTQPFPANPAYVLHPGKLTEEDMWGFTFWDRNKCREQFRQVRNDGLYTPPSKQGTLLFPYTNGIMNWGSLAIDPARKLLVVNTSRIPSTIRILDRAEADARFAKGEYLQMGRGTPYGSETKILLSPFGAPCNAPPWGTLVAIDLQAGKRLWEIPLGTTRDAAPFPLWLKLGVPSLGGPLVTASGLVFIGGTTDNFLRAFDVKTGNELWKSRLPAGGQATPMTYRLRNDGKQYLAISAGGNQWLRTKIGDSLVVYALEN